MSQDVAYNDVFLNYTTQTCQWNRAVVAGLETVPFLKKAETFADRQSSGTVPKSRDFWKIAVSDGDISSASSLRILTGIMSGPRALFAFIFLKSFATPSSVTIMSGIVEHGSPLGWGIFEVSSRVKGDSYCLLKILALSFGSACIFPFSFRGATPQLSFLRNFMNYQNLFFLPGFKSFSGSPISIRLLMCLRFACLSAFWTLLRICL